MLEINKGKQNTLLCLVSILCYQSCWNSTVSLSSSCRKQFLFLVIGNLRSDWVAAGSQLWTDPGATSASPGKPKYQAKASFAPSDNSSFPFNCFTCLLSSHRRLFVFFPLEFLKQLIKSSHLSLVWTGLKYPLFGPHLFTQQSSLKYATKSNTFFFFLNKLIYNKFYSRTRTRCQKYLVNKNPVFTTKIVGRCLLPVFLQKHYESQLKPHTLSYVQWHFPRYFYKIAEL